MKALVEDRGKLLRGMGGGEVGPSHIANEERVSGEDCLGPLRLAQIGHHDANALHRMPGSLEEPEAALPELNLVSVLDRDVRELGSGPGAEIDARPGALGKFAMARDEVGVQVRLDNMFDLPPLAGCRLKVNINVPLRIDDGGNALRANRVGCVGQAAQIESLNLHRFHATDLQI